MSRTACSISAIASALRPALSKSVPRRQWACAHVAPGSGSWPRGGRAGPATVPLRRAGRRLTVREVGPHPPPESCRPHPTGPGHGAPGWHWPALLLQSVWAFYRKLWLPGIFYALLPAAGALAFLSFAQTLDDWSVPWLLCAAVTMWLIPGVIAAILSTPLLYGRIRRLVQRAERVAGDPAHAASLLASHRSTSLIAALIFGVGALIVALSPIAPRVFTAYAEHVVRVQIEASLAALSPLKLEVEEQWSYFARMPRPLADAADVARRWTQFFDDVTVNPITGRLRVGLGPSIPELWGKTILVAPATDWLQRIHWTCIPVDIPRHYLPKECRDG